jgi:hypothetical protein
MTQELVSGQLAEQSRREDPEAVRLPDEARAEAAAPPVQARQAEPFVRAAGLDYRPAPGRDDCWHRLGRSLRDRVMERAGRVLDWWATVDGEGRTYAVVLGDQALVSALPTVNANGAPAHRLLATSLDPGSFRFKAVSTDVSGIPAAGRQVMVPAEPVPARLRAGGPKPKAEGGPLLDEPLRALLGTLPAEAQRLLLSPFADSGADLRGGRYYCRDERDGTVELFAACYLLDRTRLTFASGTRTSPPGTAEEAGAWRLTCRSAAIVASTGK